MAYSANKTVDTGVVSYNYTTTIRVLNIYTGAWTITPTNRVSLVTQQPGRRWNQRYWNRTPNYKVVKQTNGYLPTLEYSVNEWSQSYSPAWGAVWKNRNAGVYQWIDEPQVFRVLDLPSQASSGWPSNSKLDNLRSSAKNKTLAQARDMKVNIPVMFGEGRKTVEQITGTARTLGRAYHAFRRGRFYDAARELGITKPTKGAANHWLAYQYGWRPLVSDAKGLAEVAAEYLTGLHERPPRFSVSKKAEDLTQLKYTTNAPGSLFASGSTVYTGEVQTRARAGLLLETSFSASSLRASLGMGGTDILLVAWELVPFSFVFDWFIQIGQYLESLSALDGFRVLDGFDRYAIVARVNGRPVITSASTYQLESGNINPISGHERKYYRMKWTGQLSKITVRGLDALSGSTDRLKTAAALYRNLVIGDRSRGGYNP